ncbi:tail fiber domain-containing protein [Aeromonas sanarellii]|uniref:tail fiber domain-containing protein n=1 Tax=Aeromonas sanarellii TaxID=633415 RepID=UPI0039A1D8F8
MGYKIVVNEYSNLQGLNSTKVLVSEYAAIGSKTTKVIVVEDTNIGTSAYNAAIQAAAEAKVSADAAAQSAADTAAALGTKVSKAGDTMTGNLTVPKVLLSTSQGAEVNAAVRKDHLDTQLALKADKTYTDTQLALKLNLTGGTLTGNLTTPKVLLSSTQGTEVNALTRKDYVDSQDALRVGKAGDTMTGSLTTTNVLISSAQSTTANAVTRKDYVDAEIAKQVSKTGDTMTGNLTTTGVLRGQLYHDKGYFNFGAYGTSYGDGRLQGYFREYNNGTPGVGYLGLSLEHRDGSGAATGKQVDISLNGKFVYHEGRKPTASDVGALAVGDVNASLGWSNVLSKVPRITSEGILYTGRYIDMSTTNSETSTVRLEVTPEGDFGVYGAQGIMKFQKSGTLLVNTGGQAGTNPINLVYTPLTSGNNAQGIHGYNSSNPTTIDWGTGVYSTDGVTQFSYIGTGTTPWLTGVRYWDSGIVENPRGSFVMNGTHADASWGVSKRGAYHVNVGSNSSAAWLLTSGIGTDASGVRGGIQMINDAAGSQMRVYTNNSNSDYISFSGGDLIAEKNITAKLQLITPRLSSGSSTGVVVSNDRIVMIDSMTKYYTGVSTHFCLYASTSGLVFATGANGESVRSYMDSVGNWTHTGIIKTTKPDASFMIDVPSGTAGYLRGRVDGSDNWYVGRGSPSTNDVILASNAYGTIIQMQSDRVTINKAIYAPAYNPSSDRNIKSDIKTIDNCLDKASKLVPSNYLKRGLNEGQREDGVIAQDVEQVLPDSVTVHSMTFDDPTDPNAEYMDVKSVNYAGVTSLAIGAIKELHELVKEQRAEIEELKNLINSKF